MITVKIRLMETSRPIIHKNVINAYTKGRLYCVYCDDNKVYKYPIEHIFSVTEDYSSEEKVAK